MAEDDASLDLDRVVAEIAAAVEERTRSGEYPADLEERLRSHVVSLDAVNGDATAAAITEVARAVAPAPTAAPSRKVPGIDTWHRAFGARRARDRALDARLDEFASSVLSALRAIADDAEAARHEDDTVQQRLADVERAVRHVRGAVDAVAEAQHQLEERIARLERDEPSG